MVGIYKISNLTNGKCYIGQSIDLARRKREHYNNLSRNKHDNYLMQKDYNNGHKFVFAVLEETTKEALNEREMYYISLFHAVELGYNTQSGGQYGYTCCENMQKGQKRIWKDNIGRKAYQSFTNKLNKYPNKTIYELYEEVYKLKHIFADYSFTNQELKEKYKDIYNEIVRMRNYIWIAPNLNSKILNRKKINKTFYIFADNDFIKYTDKKINHYLCKCDYKLLSRRLKALAKQHKLKYITEIKKMYLDKGIKNIYNYSDEFFKYVKELKIHSHLKEIKNKQKIYNTKQARLVKLAMVMDMHSDEIKNMFSISKDCFDKIIETVNYSEQLYEYNFYIKNRYHIIQKRKLKMFKKLYVAGFSYAEYKKHGLYNVSSYSNKLSKVEKIQRQRALNFFTQKVYNLVRLLYVFTKWSVQQISKYFPYSIKSIKAILENKEVVMRPKEDYEYFKRK